MEKLNLFLLYSICLILSYSCSKKKKTGHQDSSSQNIVQKETTDKFIKPTITEKNDTAQSNLTPKNSNSKKAVSNAVKPKKQTAVDSSSFPIIFFGVTDNSQAFKMAKKWGATYVQRYGMGRSIKKDQPYFDLAEKYGLKVMSDLRMKYWTKQKHAVDSLRLYIQHFKNNPALGFWYLSDEPGIHHITASELAPFYKMIKKETPNVPVAIAHAGTKHWFNYENVEDILMFDHYPIVGGTFPDDGLGIWTNFTRKAIKVAKKGGNLAMPVIQIFNWKVFGKKGQEKVHGTDVKKLRYPNAQELRYMAFTSIAMGAKGLSFFSFGRSRMLNHNWGAKVLAPVIQEVKAFEHQVAGTQMKQINITKDKKLFLTTWKSKKSTFLILVNASPKAGPMQQSLDGTLKRGTLEPWGKTRKTKALLQDGSIIVKQVKPWEVLIWQML
jgi:hypothetical protein